MALPFDLYIRFLVTKGLDDISDVVTELRRLNLPLVDQATFDEHYNFVHATLPKGIISQIEHKTYGSDFLRWMKQLEVEELWYYEKKYRTNPKKAGELKQVYDIHQDPQLRLSIDALLIKGVPVPDIAQVMNGRFSAMLSEGVIAIYANFFFNPRRMVREDWRVHLRTLPATQARIFYIALTEPVDVLKTELDLPSKINVSDAIQFLLTKSFQKAKLYLNVNSEKGGLEAREWIDSTLKLAEKYEKYRSTDRDDFSKTLQLEFEYVDTEFAQPDAEVFKEVAKSNDHTEKGPTKDHT